MAAITIAAETDVALTAGVASTPAVAARASRRGLVLQHQGEGFVWIKLTGAASVGDGIRLGSWQILDLTSGAAGQGDATDFYEGAVNAFFEGGGRAGVQGGGGVATTVLRVIEIT